VLFLTGTISSFALSALLRASITVVPGVRRGLLERLSRATGAVVLPSVNFVDKLPEAEIIGRAAGFDVRLLRTPRTARTAEGADAGAEGAADAAPAPFLPLSARSYVVVDGCPEHLGVTVLLRGAPSETRALKPVLR
jgi:hypothetical protein